MSLITLNDEIIKTGVDIDIKAAGSGNRQKKQAASAKSAGLKKEYFPTLRKNRKIGQRISLTSDNR